MAFWKYDIFPFILWGGVEYFNGKMVYVEAYQALFHPIKVVEYELGVKMAQELEILKFNEQEENIKLKGKRLTTKGLRVTYG